MDEEVRPHPKCWTGRHYEHSCHVPSGKTCVEAGCERAAGTLWGPHWCVAHDVERLAYLSAGLQDLQRAFAKMAR